MPSIKDVAKISGVSIAAASRILNHDPSFRVRDSTRMEVEKAAQKLGYRPNQFARNLRLSNANRLALLLDRPVSYWTSHLAQSLEVAASAHELGFFARTVKYREDGPEALTMLQSGQSSGVILLIALAQEPLLKKLQRAGICLFVLEFAPTVPVDGVHVDLTTATRQLMEHLYSLGHRRISYIGPNMVAPPGNEHNPRLNTYVSFMMEAGLQPQVVETERYIGERTFAILEETLSHNRPEAVVCFYDELAHCVFHTAHKLGLTIPDDIAVAAFDDAPISPYLPAPLTTVRYPYEEVAQTICSSFAARSADPASVPVLHRIEPQLIIRRSCGARG